MDDRDVSPESSRDAAVKRVKSRRDFKTHVVSYVLVNALLIIIWALSGRGYFWPIWIIVGWGIGLAFNAWSVYFERPVSEDDIRREMGQGA